MTLVYLGRAALTSSTSDSLWTEDPKDDSWALRQNLKFTKLKLRTMGLLENHMFQRCCFLPLVNLLILFLINYRVKNLRNIKQETSRKLLSATNNYFPIVPSATKMSWATCFKILHWGIETRRLLAKQDWPCTDNF